MQKRRSKRSLLLVRFLFILLISFALSLYIENSTIDFSSLQILTAKALAFFLSGKAEGAMVALPERGFYVQVIRDCIGWKTLMALVSLWLILPLANGLRLMLVIASFPAAFILNLQRMIFAVNAYVYFGGSYAFWDAWAFRILNAFVIAFLAYVLAKEMIKTNL